MKLPRPDRLATCPTGIDIDQLLQVAGIRSHRESRVSQRVTSRLRWRMAPWRGRYGKKLEQNHSMLIATSLRVRQESIGSSRWSCRLQAQARSCGAVSINHTIYRTQERRTILPVNQSTRLVNPSDSIGCVSIGLIQSPSCFGVLRLRMVRTSQVLSFRALNA